MLSLSLRQLINEKISSIVVVFLILGKGADPNRPLCRKAKDIRKEKRLQKEQLKQQEPLSSSPSPAPSKSSSNQPKSLEDFITEHLPSDPLHRLEASHDLCLYVNTSLRSSNQTGQSRRRLDPAPISQIFWVNIPGHSLHKQSSPAFAAIAWVKSAWVNSQCFCVLSKSV